MYLKNSIWDNVYEVPSPALGSIYPLSASDLATPKEDKSLSW